MIPHFSFPFRFVPPAAVTEQDSLEEVADCCLVILTCPQGFRVELPQFGLPDPTFTYPLDLNEIREVVERWDDRAVILLNEPSWSADLIARVDAFVQVRSED